MQTIVVKVGAGSEPFHDVAGPDPAERPDVDDERDDVAQNAVEHFDVVIVGAGISGVGGAYHLKTQRPSKSFAVLESQPDFGGTWRTHRYPGIRSDSDLHTFGYRFKPWTGAPIASADAILRYMGEVIEENDLRPAVRFSHRVVHATWCGSKRRWTLDGYCSGVSNTDEERFTVTCGFLWMCQGYYRHGEGYTPQWPGMEQFSGQIVHPQSWPDDLDCKGKRVVVIGSGATAATLVPAIAADCAHVTMLQRSPTYFIPARNAIEIAEQLRALDVPEEWVHEIVRRQMVKNQAEFSRRCFDDPDAVTAELLAAVKSFLPDDDLIDDFIAEHFTPRYKPWRQRVAFIPDGDLFRSIADGHASVVTDEIDTFTTRGIRTSSGREIEADIVITATGFNLNVLGDISFTVDGVALDFARTVTYRGAMFTGLPNLLWVFGYLRASWTLRADLMGDFVCRLLRHMDERGASMVVPELRPEDWAMTLLPWIEASNFNPGYMQRSMHLLPQQGDRDPWRHTQDYWTEKDIFPNVDLDDGLTYA